jgi:hypothetical protein
MDIFPSRRDLISVQAGAPQNEPGQHLTLESKSTADVVMSVLGRVHTTLIEGYASEMEISEAQFKQIEHCLPQQRAM